LRKQKNADLTIFPPKLHQAFYPNLRTLANSICGVNMEEARTRRPGGLSGTNVRNRYYFELMSTGDHHVRGVNKSAPPYIIAGCEAAFPWGKPGMYNDVTVMPEDHATAYATDHGYHDGDLCKIMDLIVANVDA
jgi:hypothetical protein